MHLTQLHIQNLNSVSTKSSPSLFLNILGCGELTITKKKLTILLRNILQNTKKKTLLPHTFELQVIPLFFEASQLIFI
jgi:hypothetical protein